MTLNNLMTPFERRRVIEYGKDGNKVVRHWYDVQHVIGSLYKSKDFPNDWGELEFKLFVFFDGKCDGLRFEWLSHPECYTVERVADTMCRCRVDSMTHMYLELNDRMEQDKFIGNAEIEFIRQFDPAAADRYAKHREDFYARRAEQERTKALARQAEKDANRAKAQAELAAEKAKYLGWVDDMTPLRFGQVSALMDTSIRVDGKITTRREFIINCIKDGWVPQKKDGVTSWYKRGGEYKESNPRTEYELHKEGFCMCIRSARPSMTLRSIWWSMVLRPNRAAQPRLDELRVVAIQKKVSLQNRRKKHII